MSEKNNNYERILQTLYNNGLAFEASKTLVEFAYLSFSSKVEKIYNDEKLLSFSSDELSNIDKSAFESINNVFKELSIEDIQDVVYSSLLSNDYGKFIREESPEQVMELAYYLLKLNESGDMLYDMGSGNGRFLAYCYRKSIEEQRCLMGLVGSEIDYRTAIVSQMALDIITYHGERIRVFPINSLDGIEHPYTAAYVFPPIGVKMPQDKKLKSCLYDDIEFNRQSIEWLFVDRALSQLSGRSKAVALIRGSSLFSHIDEQFRNQLVKDGLVEGIIELPNNILNKASIKLFMVVFSQNNKFVKFVNASEMCNIKNKPNVLLNVKEILDVYNSENVDTRSLQELQEVPNLVPSNVLLDVTKPENGVALKELAEVFTGNQYTLGVFEKNGMLTSKNTDYCILTSSDIEDGFVNWARLQRIEYNDTKFDKYAVKKNDIIVTSKSSKVKTVVVDIQPKKKIIVTGGMIIVRPDVQKLDPTYFKIFLDSANGQSVLKSIQKGSVIVTINSSALENIHVPIIPIEKQREKAERYNEKLSTLYGLKQEILKIEESLKNFYFEESEGE